MPIQIASAALSALPDLDRSFSVTEELQLHFTDGQLGYRIVPVEPYEKTYPDDGEESLDESEVFLATLDGQPAGVIQLSMAWNGYARIDDIAVDRRLRRSGVAKALLEHACDWCRERALAGLMLETQTNNVAACRLYERFGFRLGGFDRDLYRGLDPATSEVALFWYLPLSR